MLPVKDEIDAFQEFFELLISFLLFFFLFHFVFSSHCFDWWNFPCHLNYCEVMRWSNYYVCNFFSFSFSPLFFNGKKRKLIKELAGELVSLFHYVNCAFEEGWRREQPKCYDKKKQKMWSVVRIVLEMISNPSIIENKKRMQLTWKALIHLKTESKDFSNYAVLFQRIYFSYQLWLATKLKKIFPLTKLFFFLSISLR